MPLSPTPNGKAATLAGDPLHWRNEGVRLARAGDRKRAGEAFARYLSQPVAAPELKRADAARAQLRLAEANREVRAYLTRAPNDPVALRILGHIAMTSGNAVGAEAIFRKILELAPGFAPVRVELASALLQQGKTAAALAETDRLLAANPKDVPTRTLRAQLLLRQGDFAGAEALLAQLGRERPQDARMWIAYGQSLRALRRTEKAVAAFRRAIAIRPSYGEAWWNLANMKTGDVFDAADRAALAEQLAKAAPDSEDHYHLAFAHARALEDAGEPEAAMRAYRLANDARRKLLPPERPELVSDLVRRSKALFTPELFARSAEAGHPSAAPIFILGMPRSGSTLLEQILASHPQIEGTLELPDVPVLAATLAQRGKDAGGYPEVLATQSPAQLRELGEAYLTSVAMKRQDAAKPFFTDKQPVNWMHAGLIHLILPNARIIDMRRDAFACCLSMYRQHFTRGAGFTYDLPLMAQRYRDYVELIEHWHAVMPETLLSLTLAELVDDLEGSVRRVLDHLGLPFAPECLEFHKSDRAVFTPSSEQVRQPINRAGETRIAALAPYAEDLRTLLAGVA